MEHPTVSSEIEILTKQIKKNEKARIKFEEFKEETKIKVGEIVAKIKDENLENPGFYENITKAIDWEKSIKIIINDVQEILYNEKRITYPIDIYRKKYNLYHDKLILLIREKNSDSSLDFDWDLITKCNE